DHEAKLRLSVEAFRGYLIEAIPHSAPFFVAAPAFAFGAAPGFASMAVAVMKYWIVTLAPTFRSPVTLVELLRAISHRSLPFWTTIVSLVSSSTGPVT